jgi:hypothetical protein
MARAGRRATPAACSPASATAWIRVAAHVAGHRLPVVHRRLDAETDADLDRGMHYPTRWDPFFEPYMTLAAVYRFPTQHFDFHRRQLTLEPLEKG